MPRKILIVDDDPVYLDSLVKEFQQPDEQVLVAQDGQQAINLAVKEQPTIILLDIMLPKKLGLNVIEELKTNQNTKYIPIIAMSNFGGDQNKNRALTIGASDFVVKGKLSTQEIAGIIRSF
jgi:DNA-binding response OmpR family regulator